MISFLNSAVVLFACPRWKFASLMISSRDDFPKFSKLADGQVVAICAPVTAVLLSVIFEKSG